ncbi:hypothetical protein BS47DRAFT_1363549 [Hydnum rufescens UP504]|uniref:Uncharacterized protein n=1 Tax=Hydnum rufescens UP504 TaxID=1448309 RepID=A0A9P6ATP4_9AGAM|nr:hypothetical protein BS47DRAFT_1363549 [Hydnum rufescens UP504]
MEDDFKPGILTQARSHNLFFSTNVDQAILKAELIFHLPELTTMIPENRRHHTPAVAGHCVALNGQTHMNPAPAPARTDDDDTGEQEAPHTHCSGSFCCTQLTDLHEPHTSMCQNQQRQYWRTGGTTHPLQRTRMNPTPAPTRTDNHDTGVKYGRAHSHTRPQHWTIPTNSTRLQIWCHTPAAAGSFSLPKTPAQSKQRQGLWQNMEHTAT